MSREKVKQIPDDDVMANESVKMVQRRGSNDNTSYMLVHTSSNPRIVGLFVGSWFGKHLEYCSPTWPKVHLAQDNRTDLCCNPQRAGLSVLSVSKGALNRLAG